MAAEKDPVGPTDLDLALSLARGLAAACIGFSGDVAVRAGGPPGLAEAVEELVDQPLANTAQIVRMT